MYLPVELGSEVLFFSPLSPTGPWWCSGACWQISLGFCMLDVVLDICSDNSLLKSSTFVLSPSPQLFFSSCFSPTSTAGGGGCASGRGHKFTKPPQARSSSEVHFSSFYLKSALCLYNYTKPSEYISNTPHC